MGTAPLLQGLGKFNESLKDLRTLTGQEPDNGAAKKEEKLVYDLYLQVCHNDFTFVQLY